MSSEIVERLRVQHAKGIIDLPEGWEYVHYGDAASHIEALEAENERLREDLTSIAEGNLGDMPWQANYEKIKAFASEALSQAKE